MMMVWMSTEQRKRKRRRKTYKLQTIILQYAVLYRDCVLNVSTRDVGKNINILLRITAAVHTHTHTHTHRKKTITICK
jgi:hypothetical protein